MKIRRMETGDLPEVIRLWNESVRAGEVVCFPMTEKAFQTKFEKDPNYNPELFLVAETEMGVVGFISGTAKKIFLEHETNENSPGYITCFFVRRECRGRGIGKALTEALCSRFREIGKIRASVSNDNPVNLDWYIPGTPGHDHNNMPGMDTEAPGYGFLRAMGFEEKDRETAMYLNLRDYIPWEGLERKREELLAAGIFTGR